VNPRLAFAWKPGRAQRPACRSRELVSPQGSGFEASHLEGAEEGNLRRTPGDREISDCARGLFWLQKSMSGAGSTPSGMGLAPTPHAREGNLPARFCLVQRGFCFVQRGEEASWPARGGNVAGSVESHRVHAAANPRVRAAAMPYGRAGIPMRDSSSTEGALVRRGPLPLTRRRGEAGLAARRCSLQLFREEGPRLRRRVATEGVRGHVTSSVRGRKRRDREVSRGGAFDRSSARIARCPLRRERAGPRLRTLTGNGS